MTVRNDTADVDRPLLDAVLSLAGEATLDGVLSRVVTAAAELTGASYVALGVLAEGEPPHLRSFVHRGMTGHEVEVVGDLPTGHGILGLLIAHPEPLRLHDLTAHPESFGFPVGHPPMRSFLGVPVRSGGRVFGNLYLTEKPDGDFSDDDEAVVVALAGAAGVLVQNARLQEQATRRQRWLEATARITAELVGVEVGQDALDLVVREARRTAGADAVWLAVRGPDGLRVEAASGLPVGRDEMRAVPMEGSLSARVSASGVPLRIEDIATDAGAVRFDGRPGWPVICPAVVVPLRAGDDVVGALAMGWTAEHVEDFRLLDPDLPARFAEQAALVLQVVRARAAERRLTLLEDHGRIGRDLHDVVIQRLFAVGLGLQSLAGRLDGEHAQRLESAVEELDVTVREIRRTIFALGAIDDAHDLQTEVSRLVDRAARGGLRTVLDVRGPLRTAVDEETAGHVLAVLGETLSNAVRHSGAGSVEVLLEVGDQVSLTVRDDGHGIPEGATRSGLAHLDERAHALGGVCEISSSDVGTVVRWSAPRQRH